MEFELAVFAVIIVLVAFGVQNLSTGPITVTNISFNLDEISSGENSSITFTLFSNEDIVGDLEVRFKRDMQYFQDSVVKTEFIPIILDKGQNITLELNFSPNQPTKGSMRGYFIEILLDGKSVYTMPPNYPPRLKVLYPTLQVTDVKWFLEGREATSAMLGDNVTAVVFFEVLNSEVQGDVEIFVRKDLMLSPDYNEKEKKYHVIFAQGSSFNLTAPFEVRYVTERAFKGYFIEIFFDGEKIYTMPLEYPPRLYTYS